MGKRDIFNYFHFLSELQNVLNFCKTGEYQGIEELLKAFGFFNEYEEEQENHHRNRYHHNDHGRYHHHEPKVDLKVKDEPLDSYDEDDEDYDPTRPDYDDEDDYDYDYATPKSAKKFKPKVEYDDDYDDYDDDYWTPKKRIKTEDGGWITPKKEGGGRGSLGEEESRLYENFTWPQPLESYRY